MNSFVDAAWKNKHKAELFEALAGKALEFIDAYLVEQGDYSSIKLEEDAAKLFGEIKRALDPAADHAALLREIGVPNDAETE